MYIATRRARLEARGAGFLVPIMIFSPVLPFSKIGIFMTFDISISLLFAIGLFPAMLATFGPEGKSGSIKHILCHNGCPWKRNSKKKKEGGVE